MPNFSFELNDTCPASFNELERATPWFSAYRTPVSSDLFDTCNHSNVGIPINMLGTQIAKSGKAYAGIIPYAGGDPYSWREYLEVRLNATLDATKEYCVTYFTCLTDSSRYAIENIDLKFSPDSLIVNPFDLDSLLLRVTPDITNSTSFLVDRINWMRISGVYSSMGNESFLTIGNFKNDAATNYIDYYFSNGFTWGNYYYIDDVSVVEVSPASAGNDTTICTGDIATIGGQATFEASYNWYALNGSGNMSIDSANIAKPQVNPIVTTTYVMQKTQCSVTTYDTVVVNVNCVGIKELREIAVFKVYPNPANETIYVNYNSKELTLKITDVIGKEIKTISSDFNNEIDISELSNGIYFISIVNNNHKIIGTKKFVVQH